MLSFVPLVFGPAVILFLTQSGCKVAWVAFMLLKKDHPQFGQKAIATSTLAKTKREGLNNNPGIQTAAHRYKQDCLPTLSNKRKGLVIDQ
jgi:hypothetical protein